MKLKHLIITAAAVVSFTGIATEASAMETVDTYTSRTDHGYVPGTTVNGQKVDRVEINVDDMMMNLSRMDESTVYQRSIDNTKINRAVIRRSTGLWWVPLKMNRYEHTMFNGNIFFTPSIFRSEFMKYLNTERQSKGLYPFAYDSSLQKGVDERALELAKNGSIRVNEVKHVRLDGRPFYTVYEDRYPDAKYRMSENLAMTPHNGNPYEIVSEKRIAEKLFTAWKNSPGHYAVMMDDEAKDFAVSVKIAPNTLSSDIDMFTGAMVTDEIR